jgi:MoxR-like ATPase
MAARFKEPKKAEYTGTCKRCGKAIVLGQYVEQVKLAGDKFARWVHMGCGTEDMESRSTDELRRSLNLHEEESAHEDALALTTQATQVQHNGNSASVGLDEMVVRTLVRNTVKSAVEELGEEMETRLIDRVRQRLEEPLTTMINTAVTSVATRLHKAFAAAVAPREVLVRRVDGSELRLEGEILHPKFDIVKELVECRQDIYMTGETGSGKSHLAAQVARVLGMRFGMISCTKAMSEGQLNGRLIPRGKMGQFEFFSTVLVDIYERGGLFLFDEMDAADGNTLLIINSALANGVMSIPNRTELPEGVTMEMFMDALSRYKKGDTWLYAGYGPYAIRHTDFVAIAAANTMGTGADRKYIGRDPLDLSTRDRYQMGFVEVGYSRKVERALCPGDTELLEAMWSWRRKAKEAGLERVVSTRTIVSAYRMRRLAGWTLQRVAESLFAGWAEDEVLQVYGQALPQDDEE